MTYDETVLKVAEANDAYVSTQILDIAKHNSVPLDEIEEWTNRFRDLYPWLFRGRIGGVPGNFRLRNDIE